PGGEARSPQPRHRRVLRTAARRRMSFVDWLIVAAYFGGIAALTAWVVKRHRDTADDYFLASRNLGWFVVGASIFASNIGSEHLVGLAGAGATSGVALAHYELHAWCLLVLGWVMVPFYARSMVFTMPEFLERRFSPAARTVLSLISLVAYVLTKLAVGIFAGGVVFGVLLPELHLGPFNSFWIGSVLVVLLTGLYTVLGGMRAVAYTDALQTGLLVFGSALFRSFGLKALGGWGALRAALDPDMFNLWKPLVPAGMEGTWAAVKEPTRIAWYFNGNYPWLGMLFCAPIIGLWYWTTDQYIVQRALGARDEREARRGSIIAAFLKLLPVFIFIIPGMIALALAKTGRAPGLPSLVGAAGRAVPAVAQAAFPLMATPGLRGVLPGRGVHAAEREGVPGGAHRRTRARRLPPRRRYAREPRARGVCGRLYAGLVSVDRQQHLLAVLQPVHLRRLVSRHGRRELPDGGAGGGAGPGPDVRDGHAGAPPAVAGQLESLGRDQLGRRAVPDPACVPVLPGLTEALDVQPKARRAPRAARRRTSRSGQGAATDRRLRASVALRPRPCPRC